MKSAVTVLGLAASLAACVGGAVLAPVTPLARAACRPAAPVVTWVDVPSPAEQAELDAWCAAVGAPVVVTAAAENVPRVDSLAVVTWNVKVGGGDIRSLVASLRRGALTDGARVDHFVLLLQEVYRADGSVPNHVEGARIPRGINERAPDGTRASIDALARELGLSLVYVPSMRNGSRHGAREDRGNAILSTAPLRDVVAIELPLVRQRRVAVAARMAARMSDGRPFDLQLTSVHLENRPARGVFGERGREKQMRQLLAALPPAALSVIGGDLNTWSSGTSEAAVSLVLEHHPETGPAPDEMTYDGPAFFDLKLDYLFARLADGRFSGYQVLPQRYGSDHHPVMAWLHMSE